MKALELLQILLYLVGIVTMLRVGRMAMNVSSLCILLRQKLGDKETLDVGN